MSELLKKSEENQQAALYLFSKQGWYASSVHCAYYSCIQLMIHALLTVGGKSEKEIEDKTQSGGSHIYYITETRRLIEQKNYSAVKRFNTIKDLASYRIKSDYKNVEITYDISNHATFISQTVVSTIKGIL